MELEGKKKNKASCSVYLLRNALELMEDDDDSSMPKFEFIHYEEISSEFKKEPK
jgi:hypothetical protein